MKEILSHESGVTWDKAIGRQIKERHMELWKKGVVAESVENTVTLARRGVGGKKGGNDDDSIVRQYHSMVADRQLCAAVCMITNRAGGGIYSPKDKDTNGCQIIYVFCKKHQDLTYNTRPQWGRMGIVQVVRQVSQGGPKVVHSTEGIVQKVVGKPYIGASPGSVDATMAGEWLLDYGHASREL